MDGWIDRCKWYNVLCVCICAQLCPTLCDSPDCSPPGSSVLGISQARILEWVAVSFSRGLSRPRDQTHVACIVGGFFTVWATREALKVAAGIVSSSRILIISILHLNLHSEQTLYKAVFLIPETVQYVLMIEIKIAVQIQTLSVFLQNWCGNLISSVIVFGDRAFGRWLDYEGEALMKEISALTKETPKDISPCEDTVRRQTSVNQEASPRWKPNPPVPWALIFQPPELWEMNFCCL